jgi:hypothetical protein
MILSLVIALFSFLSFISGSERIPSIKDNLIVSLEPIQPHLVPSIIPFIKLLLSDPNSQVGDEIDDVLYNQLSYVFVSSTLDFEKLEALSNYFFKLTEYLQLSALTQIDYKFIPQFHIGHHLQNAENDPKFHSIARNCGWVQHTLKALNFIIFRRKLESIKLLEITTFEKIFTGQLIDESRIVEIFKDLVSKKPVLDAKEKEAFKSILSFYKEYFTKKVDWIFEGMGPNPSDLDGYYCKKVPGTIDDFIRDHHLASLESMDFN